MFFVGSRAEVIKLAPIEFAARSSDAFESVLVTIGDGPTTLRADLEHFGIEPAFNLAISTDESNRTDVTVNVLQRLTPLVEVLQPDVIVVQGDTTAAMAGALVGFHRRVPVVHVEAGLRSDDNSVAYPDELNRKVISQLASFHLAPTASAMNNLLREGIDHSNVVITGNTIIDSLLWSIDRASTYDDPELDALEGDGRRVVLVTTHGRDSWVEPQTSLGRALATVARAEPGITMVVPATRGSRACEALLAEIEPLENVIVCAPLPYRKFVRLIARSDLIVTDSGGLQEEGPTLGKPVLVTRETTDRPESLLAGGVRLVGTDTIDVVRAITRLLGERELYASMTVRQDQGGRVGAGQRSLEAIGRLLGVETGNHPMAGSTMDQAVTA